jgi:hypothetical protein
VIVAVILSAFGSYYATATPLNAQVSSLQTNVSSYQSNVSSYESVVSSMSDHPSTTTVTSTQTNTLISVQTTTQVSTTISTLTTTTTYSTTYTTLQTVTTTRSIYPPSNSSYILTFVSGNATQSQAMIQCGYLVLTVYVTYEMHAQIPSNVVQWARNPSGSLMQPSSQKEFTNQAYLTIYSTYNYGTGFCPNDGSISSASIFVADSNNNQLSTQTLFTLQPA